MADEEHLEVLGHRAWIVSDNLAVLTTKGQT
jgi:hypothetical protein